MNLTEKLYRVAAEIYAEHGVNVDVAMKRLDQMPLSINAWQGDDVTGFESTGHALTGGCQVTGNYPGRARDAADEPDTPSLMVEILLGAACSLAGADARDRKSGNEQPCPSCGMTRQEYRKRSRLGCAGCYDHFERELQPVLRDMHCGERHAGKVPERARHATMRQRLEAALAEAVGQQQFEQAARLRDQLNELGPVPEKPVDAVRGGDA